MPIYVSLSDKILAHLSQKLGIEQADAVEANIRDGGRMLINSRRDQVRAQA